MVDGVAPFPGGEAFEEVDVADLDAATRERLAAGAVPVPGTVAEAIVEYRDERRFDTPTLLVCPEFSPEQAREWIDAGAVPEYSTARRLELVDLDSGHWPMATEPAELARILADFAKRVAEDAR